MKTYKLTLGGRGAEIFIHPINKKQKGQLQEMDIENKDTPVDWDKLNSILKTEWDSSDDTYTGAYDDPKAYYITVTDEEDNEVFSSDDDFYFEDSDYEYVEKENIFVCEHYVKGTFKEYELKIENEFDPTKLTPFVVEINEGISIITDLRYDGKEIENFEYGDDWSKGAFFYIY